MCINAHKKTAVEVYSGFLYLIFQRVPFRLFLLSVKQIPLSDYFHLP